MKTVLPQGVRPTTLAATVLATTALTAIALTGCAMAAPRRGALPNEVRDHALTVSRAGAAVLSGHTEYPEGAPKSLRLWRGNRARTLAASRWMVEAAFSPDGKYVATLSQEYTKEKSRIRRLSIWNVATGKLWREKVDRNESWSNLSWSKDAKKLAMTSNTGGWQQIDESSYTLSWEGNALVWDFTTNRITPVAGTSSRLAAVAFSPDAKRLVLGRTDGRAEIWNLGAKKARFILSAPSGEIGVLAWRPDGKVLLTISQYETTPIARLWNTGTGKLIGTFKPRFDSSTFRRALFSPNGKRLALQSDGATQIWNASTRKLITSVHKYEDDNWWIALPNFTPDGKTLFAWAKRNGLIRLHVR